MRTGEKKFLIGVGFGLAGSVLATAFAITRRCKFQRRIKNLRRSLESSPAAAAGDDRTLPPNVIALAERLHVPAAAGQGWVVHLSQRGEMWLSPGAQPLPFNAEQIIAVSEVGFLWRANFARKGRFMQVIDYFVGDEAGLEATLLGMVPLVQLTGTDSAFRGEAMRYLAELMWNPDAILLNRQLVWRVVDERMIAVGTGCGTRWAEVRLLLNEAGDIVEMQADNRPRQVGRRVLETPWFGRASDYQMIAGRRLPTQAEVGWRLNGAEFIYWRARLTEWSMDACT